MSWTVERLDWTDEALGEIELPKRRMRLRAGFGSGLGRPGGDGDPLPDRAAPLNDNDFGVEGAETSFRRVRFDRPVFA